MLTNNDQRAVDSTSLKEAKLSIFINDFDKEQGELYFILAIAYKYGNLVSKDYTKAFYYLNQAVNAKYLQAYQELADMYIHGKGCSIDLSKACDLLQIAHNAGDLRATLTLARLYAFIPDFEHDYAKAKSYLDLVISNTQDTEAKAYALYLLSNMYDMELGLDKDDKLALDLLTQSANLGFAKAQTVLAFKYLHAIGVPLDVDYAIKLLKLASDNNYIEASYVLGMLYADNTSSYADSGKAYQYLIKAARLGHIDAKASVGLIGLEYVHNIKHKDSYSKEQADEMILFLDEALQKDSPIALGGIGVFLLTAFAGQEDTVNRAINYLIKAANMGYAPALMYMAREYELGKHVTQDLTKAKELYNQALKAGFSQAKEALAKLENKK